MQPPQPLATLGGEGQVPAQEAAQVVVENYAVYHETAQKLTSLQAWVSEVLKHQQK